MVRGLLYGKQETREFKTKFQRQIRRITMRTKNIIDPISSMSTEIRELSVDELNAVSGGETKLDLGKGISITFQSPKNEQELYQQWATLGTTIGWIYG